MFSPFSSSGAAFCSSGYFPNPSNGCSSDFPLNLEVTLVLHFPKWSVSHAHNNNNNEQFLYLLFSAAIIVFQYTEFIECTDPVSYV